MTFACDSLVSPSSKYTWYSSGNYKDTIANQCGCDSIISFILAVAKSTSSTLDITACDSLVSPSGKYTWYTSGTYHDTIANRTGCDSAMTINLTVTRRSYRSMAVHKCAEYTSPSGLYTWTKQGVYHDTIPNAAGCDSLLTIYLYLYNTYNTIDVDACASYTSPSGKYVWTKSGTYNDTLPNSKNCDSVITINLNISEPNIIRGNNHEWYLRNVGVKVSSIATDDSNYVYTCGNFSQWDNLSTDCSKYNIPTVGNSDGYLAKYTQEGVLLWLNPIAGKDVINIIDIQVDKKGNAVVMGTFSDTIDLDPGVNEKLLFSNNETGCFIAQYDKTGGLLWADTLGNSGGFDDIYFTIDENCNIYNTVSFRSKIRLNLNGTDTTYTTEGSTDFLIIKRNINGKIKWVKQVGDKKASDHKDVQASRGIAYDNNGHLCILGTFHYSAAFEPQNEQYALEATGGNSDLLFAKLDTAGNFIWCKNLVGWGPEYYGKLAVNTKGEIIIVGESERELDLDPGKGTFLTPDNTDLYFVATYTPDAGFKHGNIFVKSSDRYPSFPDIRDIQTDNDDNIYLSGRDDGSTDFAVKETYTYNKSTNEVDGFIAKYNPQGQLSWVKFLSGPSEQVINSSSVDAHQDILLTGENSDTAEFLPANNHLEVEIELSYRKAFIYKMLKPNDLVFSRTDTLACGPITSTDGSETWSITGKYSEVFMNVNGTDSIVHVNLFILENTRVIHEGNTLTAVDSLATYQWIDCNNNNQLIPGATQRSFTFDEPGSYAVIMAYGSCEADTSDCYSVDKIGFNNAKNTNAIALYPNPTSGEVNLVLTQQMDEASVTVRNITGKTVYHRKYSPTSQISFELSVPAGMYFVELRIANENTFIEKLLIE